MEKKFAYREMNKYPSTSFSKIKTQAWIPVGFAKRIQKKPCRIFKVTIVDTKKKEKKKLFNLSAPFKRMRNWNL